MNRFDTVGPCYSPGTEELAAYVDGELNPKARADVEAWLTRHREAAADVDSQRELLGVWRESILPMPTAGEWDTLLDQIEASVLEVKRLRRNRWLRWTRYAAAGSVAAAVCLALLAGVQLLSHVIPSSQVSETVVAQLAELPAGSEMFVVASAADVEIVSMHAADVGTLLVGEAPVREPLVLLSPREVTLESVEPDEDSLVPGVHGDATTVPMIVAPEAPAFDRVP